MREGEREREDRQTDKDEGTDCTHLKNTSRPQVLLMFRDTERDGGGGKRPQVRNTVKPQI